MNDSRRPILFTSTPYSAVNPMFVIANELSRRGVDDIWFAADEHLRATVEALTVETEVKFSSLGEVIPEVTSSMWDDESYRAVTRPSKWKSSLAFAKRISDPDSYAQKYQRLDAVVEQVKPALMVIDVGSIYAIDLAITRKIPFVLSAPYLPSTLYAIFRMKLPRSYPTPLSGLPHQMNLSQRIANLLFRLWALAMPFGLGMKLVKFFKVFKELGVTAPTSISLKFDAAEMVLCYSMSDMDYSLPVPDKLHPIGAMIPPLPQAPDDEMEDWLVAHESIVYMAFGTITRLTQGQVSALVDVARRLGGKHTVLWTLPRDQQALLPPADELPDNLRIADWVPSQLDVLAHPNVRVFFTHAGANSFHESIHFGKPMLVRPLWFDTYDIAIRALDSGVGLLVDRPETVDPDDIVSKLTRLLTEDSFRERAEYWAQRQQATGGVGTGVDLILGCSALK